MSGEQLDKVEEYQEEKKRIQNSIISWWKNYYKIPRTDERFINLTWSDLYEDYLECLVLNEEKLKDSEKNAEFEDWEKDVFANPEKFEEWAKMQKNLIDGATKHGGKKGSK